MKIIVTTRTAPVSATVPSTYSLPLLSTGEAGVSQAESEHVASRFVPGLPEAVYVCGTDQSAGTPETPQRPLSRQNSRQQSCVKVRIM